MPTVTRRLLTALVALWAMCAWGATGTREHPLLFVTQQEIDAARERAATIPWARQRIDAIVREADAALRKPLTIPPEGGQWGQYYHCRKCAHPLRPDAGRHRCTKCRTVYSGWPYDQVLYGRTHSRNLEAARTLGLAWALTRRESYARRARSILLAYADRYTSYPLHDKDNKKGRRGARIHAQSLSEAHAMIGVTWAYDLVHSSPCMTQEDREKIENGLLREAARVIRRNDAKLSNWQTWHNAAVACIGYCLQDDELVAHAIDGPSGLMFQLDNSVLEDGFWYERSPSYHYYALDAVLWTAMAARAAGRDILSHPRVQAMLTAPVDYTFPDLTFPPVNDSANFSIAGMHRHYEASYAATEDARFLSVLGKGPRGSLQGLLWGVASLPPAPDAEPGSRVFEGLGAAVLRRKGPSGQLYVHLDYGPHGGYHGHDDKLAIVFHALGRQLAPDPGSLPYSVPLHGEWYKKSIAHNTVAVDGSSQLQTSGTLTLFQEESDFVAARAECDTASPGVAMRRTVVLTPDYMLDLFDLASDTTHTYDWAWHGLGRLRLSLPTSKLDEPPGTRDGYQHISQSAAAETSGSWHVRFADPESGAGHRVLMAGGTPTTIITGSGWTGRPPQECPLVIARREGAATSFVSVIEPYRKTPRVKSVHWTRGADGSRRVDVRMASGARHRIEIAEAPLGVQMIRR